MSDLRVLTGERIRALRKARGLTQKQLAERANLDDAYLGSVERGERNISIDTLEKLIVAFEIQPSELFLPKEVNELKLVQKEAVDEYMAIIQTLSLEQLEALRKINKEISQIILV